MPNPGSHSYDVKRTRLRDRYDDEGTLHTNDGKADRAANAELEREHPPRTLGDPDRAAGPRGEQGGTGAATPVLRSTAFVDHDLIPAEYIEAGPPLQWAGAPDGTAEFALLCEDRDAGDAAHWVAAGIPGDVTGIDSPRALPEGAVPGLSDDGTLGWRAPQPPVGDAHRLVFRLLALDRTLGFGEGVTAAEVRRAAEGHVLARGNLVGVVAR
ncbi:YbhB/YbcL family Raf kinase inhibitor-like protein [Pseudonocardia sp. C8]|uniref:YbhB/YbcL family Raf kinase inhibitor-like protein n=1 Tax=Pseudonocardia sp. C8 TaxID=2762759 RepID=UPI001643045C|nr:YbhB/YbcL family Raf kinase inhibitor-like protein [Pseudonocardia sp. C8]MBC3191069.1 YbhB/YbcL family Raf kinase inhibitor-like protein [Pseudonocardia sp. C8]